MLGQVGTTESGVYAGICCFECHRTEAILCHDLAMVRFLFQDWGNNERGFALCPDCVATRMGGKAR